MILLALLLVVGLPLVESNGTAVSEQRCKCRGWDFTGVELDIRKGVVGLDHRSLLSVDSGV